MEFILIIIAIFVGVRINALSRRIENLEKQMNVFAGGGTKAPVLPDSLKVIAPADRSEPSLLPRPEERAGIFWEWLKDDWLLKLGAFFLILGLGWFTTYAFMNNWIGPVGRITLGLLLGTLVLFFGWMRLLKYANQGEIFMGLGMIAIMVTIFAGHVAYNYFSMSSAIIIVFLLSSFVAFSSVKYRRPGLALLGLVCAGLAPFLAGAHPDQVELFTYLLAVVVGSLWVSSITGDRWIVLTALVLSFLYSTSVWGEWSDPSLLLILVYGLSAMFFLSSVLGIMRSREKTATYDLLTAVGIGILLILWIMETGFQDWQGLLLSGWAVVFVCGAFLLFRYTGKQEPLFVYAGVSAGMIAAALSAELDGATLSIALVSEISLIPVLSYFVLRDISVAIKASWLHVITAIIAFASVQSYPWYGAKVLNEDFFVLLLSGVFMIATGAYLYFEMKRTSASSTMKNVVPALCSYGSVVLYTLIWLSFGIAYPDDPIAIMLSLLIYSLSGLVFYFIGTIRQKRGLRIYGSFVLGFVVARVLLVDVWSMELSMRIVTFFLLGALFISTAFWGKRVGTISHS